MCDQHYHCLFMALFPLFADRVQQSRSLSGTDCDLHSLIHTHALPFSYIQCGHRGQGGKDFWLFTVRLSQNSFRTAFGTNHCLLTVAKTISCRIISVFASFHFLFSLFFPRQDRIKHQFLWFFGAGYNIKDLYLKLSETYVMWVTSKNAKTSTYANISLFDAYAQFSLAVSRRLVSFLISSLQSPTATA